MTRHPLSMPLIAAAIGAPACAQPLTMARWCIGGGGGIATGGSITLRCAISQHDAGVAASGETVLASGFWPIVPPGEDPCPGDFNGDGNIDTRDVLAFLNAWAARDPRSDFNEDGRIDTRDVLAFLNAWSAGC